MSSSSARITIRTDRETFKDFDGVMGGNASTHMKLRALLDAWDGLSKDQRDQHCLAAIRGESGKSSDEDPFIRTETPYHNPNGLQEESSGSSLPSGSRPERSGLHNVNADQTRPVRSGSAKGRGLVGTPAKSGTVACGVSAAGED